MAENKKEVKNSEGSLFHPELSDRCLSRGGGVLRALLDEGLRENLTAASNKQGNVRAQLLRGGSACATREASPRLLVCRRKEGKYLTFVHA